MISMLLVAAVLFAGVTAFGVRIGYALARPWVGRLPAATRARVVLAVLASPWLAGLGLGLVALLPGVLALAWPSLDHCARHGDGHLHLCFVHGPRVVELGLAWLLLAGVLGPALLSLGRSGARIRHGRRLLSALRRGARPLGSAAHQVIDADAPIALTAGLLRPRVYVTTGLLDDLDEPARQAVFAHEAAHVRRRDPLTKLLGELAAALHLPAARAMLLSDLSLACEEACDEAAAAAVGDRTTVAATLVRLGRLVERFPLAPAALVARFGDSSIAARVHALLAPPRPVPRLPSGSGITAALFVTAAACAGPIHHLTETVLATLLP